MRNLRPARTQTSQKGSASARIIFLFAFCLVAVGATIATASDAEPATAGADVVLGVGQSEEEIPTTTIPKGATPVDAEYDRLVEDALDNQKATVDGRPQPLQLPVVPTRVGDAPRLESPVFYPELAEGDSLKAASSSSNYQSDRAYMSPPHSGTYNVDIYYWLGLPTNIDPINCDDSTDCFWFVADQMSTASGVSMHIGPYHGRGQAGNSDGDWIFNVSGYDNGSYVGGLTSTESPSASWVRLRVWRLSSTSTEATWGVWAYFSGSDHYVGSITLPGTSLSNVLLFTEVHETNGPCTTDFERVYFHNPVYRSPSGGPFVFADGDADYQDTCSNTTWEQLSGTFIRDERMKTRVIDDGDPIW